jgi:pilus assembly protein CpaB
VGKRTVVLVIALVLAAISAFAVWRFLTEVEDDAREGLNEVTVYRALEFVEEGSLGADVLNQFEASTEIEELVPENAITSQEQLDETLTGTLARGPISKGQVVTTDLWAEPTEEAATFSALIEEGMQAISIRPDEVRAVGGFVRPEDRINMIATLSVDRSATINLLASALGRGLLGVDDEFEAFLLALPPEQREIEGAALLGELANAIPVEVPISFTALQDIKVLSVGSVVSNEQTSSDTATDAEDDQISAVEALGSQLLTLEVDADQAERIAWLFTNGNVWLTLLPTEGVYVPVDTLGITIDDIVSDLISERTLAIFGATTP